MVVQEQGTSRTWLEDGGQVSLCYIATAGMALDGSLANLLAEPISASPYAPALYSQAPEFWRIALPDY